MTDDYYVHEFEQHDGTLPPEDSDDEPFSEPEHILEEASLYQAISHAKTVAEERYGVGELHTTVCENGDILFFETGQPGGYRVRSTDDWQSYQPLEPEEEEGEVAPFGERNGIGEQYAKARITVERETDGFSDLTEVFSFRFNEPELTAANREPTPNITFSLVKGSQNGTMGFGDEVYGTSMVPLHTVPDSVRERASSMLDWADLTVEYDNE
jgi:hypothetical protein